MIFVIETYKGVATGCSHFHKKDKAVKLFKKIVKENWGHGDDYNDSIEDLVNDGVYEINDYVVTLFNQ